MAPTSTSRMPRSNRDKIIPHTVFRGDGMDPEEMDKTSDTIIPFIPISTSWYEGGQKMRDVQAQPSAPPVSSPQRRARALSSASSHPRARHSHFFPSPFVPLSRGQPSRYFRLQNRRSRGRRVGRGSWCSCPRYRQSSPSCALPLGYPALTIGPRSRC